MRQLVILAGLAAGAGASHAGKRWEPVRIHVECQGWGRTKACPAFLDGFIGETPLLQRAPRASAQVVLFYNVTFRAADDLVHLRFTSTLADAPHELEVLQEVDSRASDDAQREQLKPAFLRGLAPFVAAVVPEAVQITLVAPENGEREEVPTTPWGFGISVGGFGSWTKQYQSANGWGGIGVSRIDACSQFMAGVDANYGVSRQPPLIVDDQEVSLDTDSYAVSGLAKFIRNLDGRWSAGGIVRGGHEDPLGRYRFSARAHAGISRDWFRADDPRGNQLAVVYLAGFQYDRYNRHNVLRELKPRFPTHMVIASGSVRRDRVTFSLGAGAAAQMFEPRRRYVVDLSPSISITIGDHVDVSTSLSVTKQAVPGTEFDPSNFEEVTRASYAEPLRIFGSFNLNLHWDRSNPDRNNRWQVANELGGLETL